MISIYTLNLFWNICHNRLTCGFSDPVSAELLPSRFLAAGKLVAPPPEGAAVRLLTRLKYRCLRLLGVVSPSGRYPMPPDWAMNRDARQQWATDLAAGPMSTRPCTPRCPLCSDPAELILSEGANACEKGAQG